MYGRNVWNDFDFDGEDYNTNSESEQTTEPNSNINQACLDEKSDSENAPESYSNEESDHEYDGESYSNEESDHEYDGESYSDEESENNTVYKDQNEYKSESKSDYDVESPSDDYQATNEVAEEATEAKEADRNSTYAKIFKNAFDTIWDGLLGGHEIDNYKDPERQKLHEVTKDIPGFGDAIKPVNTYLQENDVPLAEAATKVFIKQSELYKSANKNGNTDARLDPSDTRMDAHLEAEVSKAFGDNGDADGKLIHASVSVVKNLSLFSDSVNHHDEADYFYRRESNKDNGTWIGGFKIRKGSNEG